ncbi:MAG: hypothetical protein ABIY56_05795, partial [Dokdonella sp.]
MLTRFLWGASTRLKATRQAITWLTLLLLLGSGQVLAEGSRDLYPSTYPAGHWRSSMDLRTVAAQRYMGAISGRQFIYVYAEAGESILLGSSNRPAAGTGGNILVYNPQAFGTRGDEARPATADFSCEAPQASAPAGSYSGPGLGRIATRAQELAGPNSADGTSTVSNGFQAC